MHILKEKNIQNWDDAYFKRNNEQDWKTNV